MQLIAKSDLFQRLDSTATALCLRNTRQGQRQLYVAQNRLVRDEVITLEHKSNRMIAVGIPICILETLGRAAVDEEITLGIAVKTANDVEQGSLTTTRRA